LEIQWDTAVPASVMSNVTGRGEIERPFEGFNVGITAGTDVSRKSTINFGCGVSPGYTERCPSGSKSFDLTEILLQGRHPRDISVFISVAAMYGPEDVGFSQFFSGNLATRLPTPPFSISVVSGSGQSGQANKRLDESFIVQVLRLDQPLSPNSADRPWAGTVNWSVTSFPNGASPGSFSSTSNDFLDLSGQVSTQYRLGSLVGNYTMQASCSLCENSAVPFTAKAEEKILKLKKITNGSLTGSAGETLRPLIVKVTDEDNQGKNNIGVSYTMISQPGGSVAATSGSVSKTTTGDGDLDPGR